MHPRATASPRVGLLGLGVLGLLGAQLALAAPALAQTDADFAAAERAFKKALADEEAGRCEQAIAELDEARRLAHKETPQVLFHLGVCHARLGRVMAARDELRAAAEHAQAQGLVAVAGAARVQLEKAQSRVATLVVGRPAHRTLKALALDGVDVTAKIGLPIEIDPGRHALQATFVEGAPGQLDVDVGEGERREVGAPEGTPAGAPPAPVGGAPATTGPAPAGAPKPESAAPAPVGSVPPPPEAPAPPGGSGTRTLGWITAGAGVALLAGGGAFWLLRDQENGKLGPVCGATQHECPPDYQSDIDRGRLYNTLADAFFVAGGAAVLAGAGLVLFGGGHTAPTTAHLAPLVLPRGGGLGVEGALW